MRNYLGILGILALIKEIYEEIAIKKDIKKVNTKGKPNSRTNSKGSKRFRKEENGRGIHKDPNKENENKVGVIRGKNRDPDL